MQAIIVIVVFVVIAIISMIVLMILVIRQRAHIEQQLSADSQQMGWEVIQHMPQWARNSLSSVELLDYHVGSLHRPIIASSRHESRFIIFGYTARGIEISPFHGRVLGLAVINGLDAPSIELERSKLINRPLNNRRHVLTVNDSYAEKWHITANDELASMSFILSYKEVLRMTDTAPTNISFDGNLLMCAGGRADSASSYEALHRELFRLHDAITEGGKGISTFIG